MAANDTPHGCGSNLDSIYYNLCDLAAVWGVVLEALAATGVASTFVLLVSLLASVPFMQDKNRRSGVALHASLLVFTAGLFGLTFAFIVGKDFSTCAARRFLFGVLFGGCFACLLMQGVRLNVLSRRKDGPRVWPLWLGAAGLWLVEVVINTEWLVVTVVRHPQGPLNATAEAGRAAATPCNIANADFAMALIYVMTLILATLLASLALVSGKNDKWKTEGVFILVTAFFSVGIWVAWIVMYVYGNERSGGPTWDDPTLAIALVTSGWVFLILYSVPVICCSPADDESEQEFGNDLYPSRGVGYETILKEQSSQNMFIENKAFSMEEPNQASKPVSPYSGYTGQLRSSVYQPTELALITKAVTNAGDPSFDVVIPRATANASATSGSSTPSTHPDYRSAAYVQTNGNGVGHRPNPRLLPSTCWDVSVLQPSVLTCCIHGNLFHGLNESHLCLLLSLHSPVSVTLFEMLPD